MASLSLSDFLADSIHFANLAPGQTVRLTMVKRLYGVPDGPYSVVIFADRLDQVAETDETDNYAIVQGVAVLPH